MELYAWKLNWKVIGKIWIFCHRVLLPDKVYHCHTTLTMLDRHCMMNMHQFALGFLTSLLFWSYFGWDHVTLIRQEQVFLFAKCPYVSLSHACQCSDGNAEHWSKYATSSSSSLDSIHRVKWRHISVVAIRLPFCGATLSYCVWISEDLSRYWNKIESV